MSKKEINNRRLGKGLNALIRNTQKELPDSNNSGSGSFIFIPIGLIVPNPYQPRQDFSEKSLKELADSIQQQGLIQPITVRRKLDKYELVAGERRWRAARKLGIEEIPSYIIEVDSKEKMLEMAIIENVQRDGLNPIELAQSYQRLIDECLLTQDQVAQKIGKDRSTVTNILRLLKLEDYIKESLRRDELSMGHARALLGVEDSLNRRSLWNKTLKGGWSVRKLEQSIKSLNKSKSSNTGSKNVVQKTVFHKKAEDRFRDVFGTQVRIYPKKRGGSIEIEYYSLEDLDRIIEIIDSFEY